MRPAAETSGQDCNHVRSKRSRDYLCANNGIVYSKRFTYCPEISLLKIRKMPKNIPMSNLGAILDFTVIGSQPLRICATSSDPQRIHIPNLSAIDHSAAELLSTEQIFAAHFFEAISSRLCVDQTVSSLVETYRPIKGF